MFFPLLLIALSSACPQILGDDDEVVEINRAIRRIYEIGDDFLSATYIPAEVAMRLRADRQGIEAMMERVRYPLDRAQIDELTVALIAAGESLNTADNDLVRRAFFRRVSVAAPGVAMIAIDVMKNAILSTGMSPTAFSVICGAATVLSIPACNRLLIAVDESLPK